MRIPRVLLACLSAILFLALAACGGGGSSAPAPVVATPTPGTGGGTPGEPNVVAVTMDGGTDGTAFNTAFVTVTLCVPGTSTCRAIDHVLIDTGSYGVRILASALGGLALPAASSSAGAPLAECAPFVSGYAWGAVRTADLRVAGESAANLPVQVVNDASVGAVPQGCSSGRTNFGVGAGANGIIGIGVQTQDCGSLCATSASAGLYYGCATGTCTATTVPLASQVANPIPFFATDNNGAVIVLPTVPLTGAASATGTLTFGIGTRANNQLGNATVFASDAGGGLQTTFNGTRYSSYFDTGSNALFFPDKALPSCYGGFYCPTTPQTLTATVSSVNGASATVGFTVEGLQAIAGDANVAPVAGDSSGLGRAFDWGLPFFFGRTVYVALAGASTPAGPGPYWAF